MSKTGKIIIGIIIGGVLIYLVLRFVGKGMLLGYEAGKAENTKLNGDPTTTSVVIPEAVQNELKYHNEGEKLTYKGTRYVVIGGQWVKI